MLLRPLLRTIKQRTEKIAHSSLMITLTEGAEKQVSKLLENRGKDSKGIRIGVTTKGCSGLSYSLEFVDDIQNSDEKVSFKDFTLFIDPKATFFSMEIADFARAIPICLATHTNIIRLFVANPIGVSVFPVPVGAV